MYSLENRIFPLRQGEAASGCVALWMSRDQRVADNWALTFAQEIALKAGLPLIVVFTLSDFILGAARRQYGFMLEGLKRVAEKLKGLAIPFFILPGNPGDTLPEFIVKNGITFLVTDLDPLRIKKQWKETVARKTNIPFYEVDTHNIVPCRHVSDKREYGAYTIRKKIGRLLPIFLDEMPTLQRHPYQSGLKGSRVEPERLLRRIKADASVPEVPGIIAGEDAARERLALFLDHLDRYSTERNDPTRDAVSHLSPYLHFGQISAQRVALEVRRSSAGGAAKDAFLEELIVRRELSDNYCHYTPNYDSFDAFPEWAKKTLDDHRRDKRTYLYSRDELESAATHDPLWNAAQVQMTRTGSMHGYMRMYWAKKILEWTPSPEDALAIAIYLNDRYFLDGRDPNGYTGIAWSLGGVHDRPWSERNVFGKIRYMSYNGCASKFNIKRYIETFKPIE
jgi:deoxyribodipyrimidine photo-lyase